MITLYAKIHLQVLFLYYCLVSLQSVYHQGYILESEWNRNDRGKAALTLVRFDDSKCSSILHCQYDYKKTTKKLVLPAREVLPLRKSSNARVPTDLFLAMQTSDRHDNHLSTTTDLLYNSLSKK